MATWAKADAKVRRQIEKGRERLAGIPVPDAVLVRAAQLCQAVGSDGLRGELTLMRAARALAALQGDAVVDDGHLKRVAPFALRHRLRRNPLDDTVSSERIERAVADLWGG